MLAIVGATAFPSLTEMSQRNPVAILPADSPVNVTAKQMTETFGESGSENILLVVLTNDKGLNPTDEAAYNRLVVKLRADRENVVMLQDFLSTPPLREVLASKDNKAWILPVGLSGELGTPKAYAAYQDIANIVKTTVAGTTLTAYLTGPAATVADLTDVGDQDRLRIELAIAVMLLLILLVIYRNPLTMLLPLVTIGGSLVVSQAAVSGAALLGLGVSNQTIVLLSGMIAGAGTDYAVFLISRYHDYVRLGDDSTTAVRRAMASIGKVIAASAATVAVTFLGMAFAKLGLFSTIGLALAIAIGITFLAAVTLLPALIVIAGPRGWVSPRRDVSARFWRRSGIRIVRRPVANLVASMLVLIILASCALMAKYNYDDRKALPASVGSSVGYAAMDRHFSLSATIPQYLFVQSPHDLRTPEGLADLEQMAQRVSQLPDIVMVRGITRPTGVPLEQARLSYQAGEVGTKIDDASDQIKASTGDLDLLASGSNALADSLGEVQGEVADALVTIRGLVDTLGALQSKFGGATPLKNVATAEKLIDAMRKFGETLEVNLDNANGSVEWADPVLAQMNANPQCNPNPACTAARVQLQKLIIARNDGTLEKFAALARQMRDVEGTNPLGDTVTSLTSSLDAAVKGLRAMGMDNPTDANARLDSMQRDAETLADASRRLAGGVQLLVDQTKRMGGGLGDAAAFLMAMNRDASSPAMSGFYIPSEILVQDDFRKAAQVFISADGRAARYLVQTSLNPFSTQAMDQVNSIVDTARGAQPNTALADAKVSMVGYTVTLRDTRDYYDQDIRLIIIVTIVVVLLILIALLRAVVAPLYLVGSVILSYLAALGIGVVVFQMMLGQELHWSIPGLTFIILVAVGADYNMLLISRIRDESPHGIRSGVIRTVGSTGGVITAAGVIFAASMYGLLFSGIGTIVQAGFIVGTGILLDTFVVRTVTVPAIAVLVGRANWWPSKWQPGSSGSDDDDRRSARKEAFGALRRRMAGNTKRMVSRCLWGQLA